VRELGLVGDEVAELSHISSPAREPARRLRTSPLAGANFSRVSPAQGRFSPSMMFPTVLVSDGTVIVMP
jgi:hypothetical protein